MFRRDRSNPDLRLTGEPRSLGMTPDEAVDALLDREIAPAELPEALALIAGDPEASARLEAMRSMFDELRAPVEAPDLSDRILGDVGRRRRWLTPGLQRVVTVGRVAIAACVLAAIGATLAVERANPNAAIFGGPEPTPLTSVVDATRHEASIGLRQVGGLFDRAVPAPDSPDRSVFLLGAVESTDAAGRLLRLCPEAERKALSCRSDEPEDAIIVDLTGRDRAWRVGAAPAAPDAVPTEATRWVLLPRNR